MSRINFKPCFSSKDTKVLDRHLYYYLVEEKRFKNNLHFTNKNLKPRYKKKISKPSKKNIANHLLN